MMTNYEKREEPPHTLRHCLQVSMYVTYNAGNAGPGWPANKARGVRIPWVTLAHALSVFQAACNGLGPVSGLPHGIVPDMVRVCIEARPGVSYNMKDCSPWMGTYAVWSASK